MQFLSNLFNLLFPKTAEPRHDRVVDDKFMQSGVWGTVNGQIVDLRRHDPVRAARALGHRKLVWQTTEYDVSPDGSIEYRVERLVSIPY